MTTRARPVITARRVLLRVHNVAALPNYHGRDAALIGTTVDAVELTTDDSVAYVDDRDGEAWELAEAVVSVRVTAMEHTVPERVLDNYEGQLRQHAMRRLLHGEVVGVRA